MYKNYLFSVTDKALYDALNTSKMTNTKLRELFLTRGVIISLDTPREELAKLFSKYNHDFYDHQEIASAMGAYNHKEKTSSMEYVTELTKDKLELAVVKLKEKINADQDLCLWHETKTGAIQIDIKYQTLDYTKSEFKQVVKKDAVIMIEETQSGYNVRHPSNPQVENYNDFLREQLDMIAEGNECLFNTKTINLTSIEDPKLRTSFFKKLLKKLPGYKLKDVTDVYVYHAEPDEDEMKKIGDSGIRITKASLKGEGVLDSDELADLYARKFYISKIRWKFVEDLPDSDIYEAEVQFDDPKEFKDFSYITRGKFKYKGGGEYNKSTSKLDEGEETAIIKKIECTARQIIDEIVNSVIKEIDNEPSESETV